MSTPDLPHGHSQPGQDGGSPQHGPSSTEAFFNSLRRTGVVRTNDRWLGGVAGGVARKFGIDPVLVRSVWGVTCLIAGIGCIIYGLAWLLLPEESDGRIHAQQALIGDVSAGLAGSIAMTIYGIGSPTPDRFILFGGDFSPFYNWSVFPLTRVLIPVMWITLFVVVLLLIIRAVRNRHRSSHASGTNAAQSGTSQSATNQAQSFPAAPGTPFTYPTATGAPAAQPAANPNPQSGGTGTDASFAASGEDSASTDSAVHAVKADDSSHTQADELHTLQTQTTATTTAQTGAAKPLAPEVASQVHTVPSQTASAPYHLPQAAPAQPQPRPRRPRTPGPGGRQSLIILATVLLALAGVWMLLLSGATSPIGAVFVAIGACTALLGIGVITSALRYRRGGWMTGVGWLAALVAIPALSVSTLLPAGTATGAFAFPDIKRIVITSSMLEKAQAEGGILDLGTYSTGSIIVDFTHLADAQVRDVKISIALGSGRLDIATRQGLPLDIDGSVKLGRADSRLHDSWDITGVETSQITDYPARYDGHGEEMPAVALMENDPLNTHLDLHNRGETSAKGRLSLNAQLGYGFLFIREKPNVVNWQGYQFGEYWIASSWQDAKSNIHQERDADTPDNGVVKVEGISKPLITTEAASQCLARATAWTHDGIPDEEKDLEDEWVNYDNLDRLSSRSRPALIDCFKHLIDGGDVKDVPDNSEQPSVPASSTPSPSPSADTQPTSTEG